jgi:malate dehydrogenase (oxaloacetate-decarboxylating)(NADP+)
VRPHGVIHKGRDDLDQWKSAHAVVTERRRWRMRWTEPDVFLGLSAARGAEARMGD